MADTEFYRPDGPYSWRVLAMVILNSFTLYGFTVGTTGVLSETIPELFDGDQATTNIVPSLFVAVFLFAMPFLTLLMRVVGVRNIAAIGAAMGVLGVVSSAFVTELWQLILSYSVVAGLGFSFSLVATLGIIPHYLQERKAAAYAGIGLGAGVGMAAFPVCASSFINGHGFKCTMLCLSTTLIFPIVAVFVFKPQPSKDEKPELKDLKTTYNETSNHFVTVFFMINSLLTNGGRAAIVVMAYTIISARFEPSVAVFALTIFGVSFLVANLGFTLYALKFKPNYLILHLTVSVIAGVIVCTLPTLNQDFLLYIAVAANGCLQGAVFCFKGNVIAHLYPTKDIAYVYGLAAASGGIGSFVIPLGASFLETNYCHGAGFFFVGACIIFSSTLLCLAALVKPKLWKEYSKRSQMKENPSAGSLSSSKGAFVNIKTITLASMTA